MSRFFFKYLVFCILVSASLIIVTHILSYDATYLEQIEATFSSEELCSGICLMGILPGETNMREAHDLLAAHPWVSEQGLMRLDGGILWSWSGEQPALINGEIGGVLSMNRDKYIQVRTTIPIHHLERALGEPAYSELKGSIRQVFYRIYYPDRGMKVYATARCPANMDDLLSSPARIVWAEDLQIPDNPATSNFSWETTYCHNTVST